LLDRSFADRSQSLLVELVPATDREWRERSRVAAAASTGSHSTRRCRSRSVSAFQYAMPDTTDTDKRLTDLEIKASFTEDLVDHLNDLVARQQQQIELLIREVGKLKDRAPDTGGEPRDLRDELPPHY
jgi:SlyX protein